MIKNRQARTTRKSQNKGRVISVILHAILLLVAFLPFLSMQTPEEPTKEALVIQFDYPYNQYVAPEKFVEKMEMGTQSTGSEAGGSTPSDDPIQPRPVEAAPSRLSAPALTSITKTSTNTLSSDISDIPLPMPKIYTKEAWAPVDDVGGVESDGVEELKLIQWSSGDVGEVAGSGDGDDDSDVWNDGYGSGTGGSGSGSGGGPGDGKGTGSGPGGGGTGAGGLGKGSGIKGVNSGITGMEYIGEGDLSRSLIKRAPTAGALAVKEGRISVYICVDRNGRVVSSVYNATKSTIKDASLLAKAQETVKQYVFAPDIMGPDKECGNFYFVFKFD